MDFTNFNSVENVPHLFTVAYLEGNEQYRFWTPWVDNEWVQSFPLQCSIPLGNCFSLMDLIFTICLYLFLLQLGISVVFFLYTRVMPFVFSIKSSITYQYKSLHIICMCNSIIKLLYLSLVLIYTHKYICNYDMMWSRHGPFQPKPKKDVHLKILGLSTSVFN